MLNVVLPPPISTSKGTQRTALAVGIHLDLKAGNNIKVHPDDKTSPGTVRIMIETYYTHFSCAGRQDSSYTANQSWSNANKRIGEWAGCSARYHEVNAVGGRKAVHLRVVVALQPGDGQGDE